MLVYQRVPTFSRKGLCSQDGDGLVGGYLNCSQTSAARQAVVLVCERSPTNALDAEGRIS